jgi:hypothetical protein
MIRGNTDSVLVSCRVLNSGEIRFVATTGSLCVQAEVVIKRDIVYCVESDTATMTTENHIKPKATTVL